jgi:hypothetical protein
MPTFLQALVCTSIDLSLSLSLSLFLSPSLSLSLSVSKEITMKTIIGAVKH